MRNVVKSCAVALILLSTGTSSALVWPDVPDRIERDLGATDANTRRIAARQILQLGVSRATPLVIRALNDADDEVRMAAADSAIRLRVAPATDLVLPWLLAKDARTRKKACEVARAMPTARAVAPLSRALGDPDQEVRQVAAEALGSQGSPDAVAALLGKLDDSAPAVRIQIVLALARLGDVRAVVPLIGKARDSSQEVRQAVAHALGDFGDRGAAQALISQLQDQMVDVKREALSSLGRLKVQDAVDPIAPFVSDRVPQLREAAFEALGRIATADAVRTLISSLGSGDDAGGGLDHTPARDALVACGAAALPQLRAVLEGQPNPQVATSAAWIIGEMKATSEAPFILGAMRRGALPTAAALNALAGAGTSDAVAVVLEFVGDPSPVVRAEALRAAGRLLDPAHPDGRAVEPLSAALRDGRPSPQERATLATLLGRTGAPRAAPVLIDLVSAHDHLSKLAALDALGMLGAGSGATAAAADDAVLEQLSDADASVRLHAAVALSEAGGVRAREELLRKLDGGDEIDRSVVLTALGGVLSRLPTDAAVARLSRDLDLSAGPERDAILQAMGRATIASAARAIEKMSRSNDKDDRKTVATLLPAQAAGSAASSATAVAITLSNDSDATVRAQAVWSLGALGDASVFSLLDATMRAPDIDAAANAAAALGRIAARLAASSLPGDGKRQDASDAAARVLCAHATDGRAYVRANSFAALASFGARCDNGAKERHAMESDPSDAVRGAAALAVHKNPSFPDDMRALEKCAEEDHSGLVAHRCRVSGPMPTRAHAVDVFVVGEGASTPHAHSAYALELADGLLHTGTADRRGAVFEPAAPEGEISLRRSSALSK